MAIERDPIHLFLEYQLPQMIAQAKEAEKNRNHDIEMQDRREQAQLNVLEKQQQISQQNALDEFNLEIGLKDREYQVEKIRESEETLRALGVTLSEFDLKKDEDRSQGGKEIFELVQGEAERNVISNIENLNTIDAQLNELERSYNENQKTLDIVTKINQGMAVGQAHAGLVGTELGVEGVKDEDDFYAYLAAMENPFEEGTPQYAGFKSQIPTHEEALGLGKIYLEGDKIKAQTAKAQAEARKAIIEANQEANGVLKSLESTNQQMLDQYDTYVSGMEPVSEEGFRDHTVSDLSKLSAEVTDFKDPVQIDNLLKAIEANVQEQLKWNGDGYFTDSGAVNMIQDFDGKSRAEKREEMLGLIRHLKEGGLDEADFGDDQAQGRAYMETQLEHYLELLNGYNHAISPSSGGGNVLNLDF